MGLWDQIKDKAQAPMNIANPDSRMEIDPEPGRPINGAPTPGLKFKPIEPVETLLDPSLIDPNFDLIAGEPEDAPPRMVMETVVRTGLHDPENQPRARLRRKLEAGAPPPDKGGRPRVYATNAERQKKYRERQKAKKQ